MYVFALILAAAMVPAAPHHNAMQGGHSMMSGGHAMKSSNMSKSHGMKSDAMHSSAMHGHMSKPAPKATP